MCYKYKTHIVFFWRLKRKLRPSLVVCACMLGRALRPHGLQPTRLFFCPWDFPGKNIEVGYHFLLQGIFLTQGSKLCLPHLLHWQADSLPLATWEALLDGAVDKNPPPNTGTQDPTCLGATIHKPVHHIYWTCALEPRRDQRLVSPRAATIEAHVPRVCALQQEKPLQWEALVQQWRLNAAKKKINKLKKKKPHLFSAIRRNK